MRETLIVSSRGQITLPAAIRKRIGIAEGGVVILEDRGHEIVLKPAAVFKMEMYSDACVADFDKDDRMTKKERESIRRKAKEGR